MLRRLRSLLLWSGSLLCVLVAVAFVASAWYLVVIRVPTPFGPSISLHAGSALFIEDELRSILVFVEPSTLGLSLWNDWGWGGEFWVYVKLPLYAVFVAVAVPTLLVWRFGRKPIKVGHCSCGYDLCGNESGRCPECGRGCQ